MTNDLQPRIELLCLLALPLAAAIVVALLGPRRKEAVRWISLAATCTSLFLALLLAWRFMNLPRQAPDHSQHPTFQPVFVPGSPGIVRNFQGEVSDPYATSWDMMTLGRGAIQFYIGLDGLNLWLVVLTAVLSLPAVLISWNQIDERVNEFYAWLLALQTAMMGIFLSFDIILFYVFFELSLVPLFFLIGIWGGPERRHAAGKFFIYTLTGSLITLLGVIGVVLACQAKSGQLTFSIPELVRIVHTRLDIPGERDYWLTVQSYVFLALMAGFAVKVPLVPFHTWLPLAHVEAPTAGSVDLAGVLLKVGAYGFLRLCVPLAPDVSLSLGLPLISGLAAIGIVYGALCAYAQDDIKKMVAYSSVSHLGLCMLGMFALNPAGLSGSLMQMINHGLSTAGLFLLVGMIYERYHTRKISDYGGMAARLPLMGACMVFICLTSVGLPGLNGFIGEALALFGVFEQQYARGQFPWYAAIGSTGMILGAWYLFTMLQRVFFGAVKEPHVMPHEGDEPIADLNVREIGLIVPIMALCLLIGIYPQPILKSMRADVDTIAYIADLARSRAKAHELQPVSIDDTDREEQAP
jgi:NADH-quinone oxidoreductase subunit M